MLDWFKTYEVTKGLVTRIILSHSLKVIAIASAKVKDDAIDFRILAQLLVLTLFLGSSQRAESWVE